MFFKYEKEGLFGKVGDELIKTYIEIETNGSS